MRDKREIKQKKLYQIQNEETLSKILSNLPIKKFDISSQCKKIQLLSERIEQRKKWKTLTSRHLLTNNIICIKKNYNIFHSLNSYNQKHFSKCFSHWKDASSKKQTTKKRKNALQDFDVSKSEISNNSARISWDPTEIFEESQNISIIPAKISKYSISNDISFKTPDKNSAEEKPSPSTNLSSRQPFINPDSPHIDNHSSNEIIHEKPILKDNIEKKLSKETSGKIVDNWANIVFDVICKNKEETMSMIHEDNIDRLDDFFSLWNIQSKKKVGLRSKFSGLIHRYLMYKFSQHLANCNYSLYLLRKWHSISSELIYRDNIDLFQKRLFQLQNKKNLSKVHNKTNEIPFTKYQIEKFKPQLLKYWKAFSKNLLKIKIQNDLKKSKIIYKYTQKIRKMASLLIIKSKKTKYNLAKLHYETLLNRHRTIRKAFNIWKRIYFQHHGALSLVHYILNDCLHEYQYASMLRSAIIIQRWFRRFFVPHVHNGELKRKYFFGWDSISSQTSLSKNGITIQKTPPLLSFDISGINFISHSKFGFYPKDFSISRMHLIKQSYPLLLNPQETIKLRISFPLSLGDLIPKAFPNAFSLSLGNGYIEPLISTINNTISAFEESNLFKKYLMDTSQFDISNISNEPYTNYFSSFEQTPHQPKFIQNKIKKSSPAKPKNNTKSKIINDSSSDYSYVEVDDKCLQTISLSQSFNGEILPDSVIEDINMKESDKGSSSIYVPDSEIQQLLVPIETHLQSKPNQLDTLEFNDKTEEKREYDERINGENQEIDSPINVENSENDTNNSSNEDDSMIEIPSEILKSVLENIEKKSRAEQALLTMIENNNLEKFNQMNIIDQENKQREMDELTKNIDEMITNNNNNKLIEKDQHKEETVKQYPPFKFSDGALIGLFSGIDSVFVSAYYDNFVHIINELSIYNEAGSSLEAKIEKEQRISQDEENTITEEQKIISPEEENIFETLQSRKESFKDESADEKTINDAIKNQVNENENIVHERLANDDFTTEELTNDIITNEEVTSNGITAEELTNDELTTEELTNDELTNKDLTNEELTNDELTNEESTNEELTNEELTNDEPNNEELTTEEEIVLDENKVDEEKVNSLHDIQAAVMSIGNHLTYQTRKEINKIHSNGHLSIDPRFNTQFEIYPEAPIFQLPKEENDTIHQIVQELLLNSSIEALNSIHQNLGSNLYLQSRFRHRHMYNPYK